MAKVLLFLRRMIERFLYFLLRLLMVVQVSALVVIFFVVFLPAVFSRYIVPFTAGIWTEQLGSFEPEERIPLEELTMEIDADAYLSMQVLPRGYNNHVIVKGLIFNDSSEELWTSFSTSGTELYLGEEKVGVFTGGKYPWICSHLYEISVLKCDRYLNLLNVKVNAGYKYFMYFDFEVDDDVVERFLGEEFSLRIRQDHFEDYIEVKGIKGAEVCEWEEAKDLRSCIR